MFIKKFNFVFKMHTTLHANKFFSDIFIGHAEFGYGEGIWWNQIPPCSVLGRDAK